MMMNLTLIPFAVCTRLVPFQFQQTLDCLCVLRSALCSRIDWPSRHDEICSIFNTAAGGMELCRVGYKFGFEFGIAVP